MSYADLIDQTIHSLKPYKAGLTKQQLMRETGAQTVSKFASNESPIVLSKGIREAILCELDDAHAYPDYQALISQIAEYVNVGCDQVLLGNGSIDVIELAFRLVSRKGAHLLCAQYGYSAYPLLAKACGLEVNSVSSLPNFGFDLPSLAAHLDQDTAIVAIDSPSNMAGATVAVAQLDLFLSQVRKETIVVLDQAYIEFCSQDSAIETVKLLKKYPNLLITRTFSKGFGLAGLRIGYGLANPELIEWLQRLQRPFPLAGIAVKAAQQALLEREHLAQIVQAVEEGKQYLKEALANMGLKVIDGEGNFLLINAGEQALALNEYLLSKGLIIRPMNSYGRPDLLRISPANAVDNLRLVTHLQAFFQSLEVTS
ncbi:histidinol-phosphate transaminase [Pseudoalteromonas umbrosa]|uniref:histidinol-phosphate transaminase n=1 Tax=Pseudoalteromonas umbrosa TaxID=3048489 RepID=UPI0024C307C5|nr:histidinol-phosphate transaminase [Pseudoalteromonas sp. B95]MDK1290629.1 histidinol-phosphate transaminase [Pseudoalteromonas sp. B95]